MRRQLVEAHASSCKLYNQCQPRKIIQAIPAMTQLIIRFILFIERLHEGFANFKISLVSYTPSITQIKKSRHHPRKRENWGPNQI